MMSASPSNFGVKHIRSEPNMKFCICEEKYQALPSPHPYTHPASVTQITQLSPQTISITLEIPIF